MSAKKTKCAVKNDHIQACTLLANAMEESTSHKGLVAYHFFNIKTGKPTRSLVAMRSGNYRKRPLVVLFCPFCGASISHHLKTKKKVAA
jgi:hypothetical protein